MERSSAKPSTNIREVSDDYYCTITYSFCTLVTKPDEYRNMVELFVEKGFTEPDCEYLYIDNSQSNKHDAYSGYNRFLQQARGKYIILCHQDIEPIEDDRSRLDWLLTEVTQADPAWGLCGNAGANCSGDMVVRISDPWHANRNEGRPFPAPVMSLDENFILVRRDANLALSRDLKGYHWYGSDLCIVASVLGWSSYVIDFHLRHKSGGNKDTQFYKIRYAFRDKLAKAFRPRWHFSITWEPFFISASPLRSLIAQTSFKARNLTWRVVRKVKKQRLTSADANKKCSRV
jgi:hypothetical protein